MNFSQHFSETTKLTLFRQVCNGSVFTVGKFFRRVTGVIRGLSIAFDRRLSLYWHCFLKKVHFRLGYLEYLIKCNFSPQMNINGVNNFTLQQMGQPQMMTSQPQMTSISILTPDDVNQRGCQLSLVFSCPVDEIFQELTKRGVVVSTDISYVTRWLLLSAIATFSRL